MRSPLLAMLAFVAGCGGLVVFVDEDGGAGGAGQGGQPSVDTPTGSPCEKLCWYSEKCGHPDCLENCLSNYAVPGCEAEADASLLCQFDNFDPVACALGDACWSQVEALHACQDAQ